MSGIWSCQESPGKIATMEMSAHKSRARTLHLAQSCFGKAVLFWAANTHEITVSNTPLIRQRLLEGKCFVKDFTGSFCKDR